jgi:hypothetical protein
VRLALALSLALACGQLHAQAARKGETSLRAPAKVEKVVPRTAERRYPDSPPSQTQQLQQQIEEKRLIDQRNRQNQAKPAGK